MHVAYLTGIYIHQDEPWYLNILCVRVTCKVHKSRKPGDNCTQVTCHSSWKGGRYLQETIFGGISPVSIDCWKRWANTGPNSVASSFRTLGWSSSGPKALKGFKPLRTLITPSWEIISFMKGAYLSRSGTWVCSFLLNTSVNWPLNSSAFSRSDSATPPFHSSSSGMEYLECLFSDYWCWCIMYYVIPFKCPSVSLAAIAAGSVPTITQTGDTIRYYVVLCNLSSSPVLSTPYYLKNKTQL